MTSLIGSIGYRLRPHIKLSPFFSIGGGMGLADNFPKSTDDQKRFRASDMDKSETRVLRSCDRQALIAQIHTGNFPEALDILGDNKFTLEDIIKLQGYDADKAAELRHKIQACVEEGEGLDCSDRELTQQHLNEILFYLTAKKITEVRGNLNFQTLG